ncbi:HsdM family class I SAM-dependent methyltransferase [Streptomyces mirabilis]|uniref:site-specific DNA-methyltransferase (adenine-specific) n=1 Tax=Streptomyces mirabilis TaxID=68239 RepID=A0A1I2DED8_9ACTN|nr:class I SAM-dependent DNA methyltransferase [Streptomyces mirabilis]MCX4433454.1 type I restriction-modification system subunit M [Streptomyces mirabilis]SFE78808.1 type I restriction enzyme M protein [Streptomyces mirabilis]
MSTTYIAPPASTTESTSTLVSRLWSYCELLRHSGVSTLDYVEQLTYLLFLKMADEKVNLPDRFQRAIDRADERIVPKGKDWPSLTTRSAEALVDHYEFILEELGQRPGTMLGEVFLKAQNKIHDPATLERLIKDLIGKYRWNRTDSDIKGDAYEGLLQRGAEDRKTGAGQYFTPRPLIDAMVECVEPKLGESISDPACGTGGFLIAAYAYLVEHYEKDLHSEAGRRLQTGAITGYELVRETARLALMNMLLHGIGRAQDKPLITVQDSLAKSPIVFHDIVFANPPFGVGSVTGESYASRTDFWEASTNKQLNFLQHIVTMLKTDGRAAVVLPDNVLFEGGAGAGIRRKLLDTCNVHTLLRLPTGIFYANGVKANVLFFDKSAPRHDGRPATEQLWVYDFRTDQSFTLKQRPMRREHLDDFVKSYKSGNGDFNNRIANDRFRPYSYSELIARDKVNLDLTVLQDSTSGSGRLASPEVIAQGIVDDLTDALAEFTIVAEALKAAKRTVGSSAKDA